MRKFYRIFIIIFLVISFFIIKDDFYISINKVLSVLQENNYDPIVNLIEKEKVKLMENIDTPGALRITDGLLLNIKDNVPLSKEKIIEESNRYRKENNLPNVKENYKLNLSAEKKLQDMADNQYFEHNSPAGLGVGDLGNEVGYDYILIGENLAMGNFKDDSALVDAWMASEGHRANILNKNYTEIGVAVKKIKFENKNVWMAVQHFATPKSFCINVDEVLGANIKINQNELRVMEEDLVKRREMINSGVIFEGKTTIEQIDIFNNLVNIYNNLINETKEKINNYNNQIQEYNSCVSNFL